MPRPKSAVPAHSLHRSSGQACVYIDRQRVYLGRCGTPESEAKYSGMIAGRAAGTSALPIATADDGQRTLPEVHHRGAAEVQDRGRRAEWHSR